MPAVLNLKDHAITISSTLPIADVRRAVEMSYTSHFIEVVPFIDYHDRSNTLRITKDRLDMRELDHLNKLVRYLNHSLGVEVDPSPQQEGSQPGGRGGQRQ